MGADQSTAGPPTLKSQRDEDIPYTSYSISKPIDSDTTTEKILNLLKKGVRKQKNNNESLSQSPRNEDTPRQSPRLHLKSKSQSPVPHKDRLEAIGGGPKHDIVVVAEGNTSEEREQSELKKLEEIPVFFPIMRSTLNIPNMRDADIMDRMDTKQVLHLCARYQEHMKQCSEAIAFDQNALCVRIKEIDFAIGTLNQMVTERQKKYAKYAEQVQKVQEISSVLTRIKMNVDELTPLMDRLNSVLPSEDQLEPFTMRAQLK